jgi:hypothetical protein
MSETSILIRLLGWDLSKLCNFWGLTPSPFTTLGKPLAYALSKAKIEVPVHTVKEPPLRLIPD